MLGFSLALDVFLSLDFQIYELHSYNYLTSPVYFSLQLEVQNRRKVPCN